MNMNSISKAFAVACLASAANSLEYPGDKCCRFWTGKDFAGQSHHKCYDGEINGSFTSDMYRSVESVFCGRDVDFEIRKASKWVGLAENDIHGAGYYLNGDLGSGANSATYYTLKAYNASTKGALTFFDSEDCSGLSGRVY